jgi:crotonobetainyl-CoA:carnitine CoA-transferase CaiB-like acyl-CoA transferase
MDLLQQHGVPAMPSFNGEELFTNPHLLERGPITKTQHSVIGTRPIIAPPWIMSETPPAIHRTAPLLGEDNEYVFCELLGLTKDEVDRLAEAEVVY